LFGRRKSLLSSLKKYEPGIAVNLEKIASFLGTPKEAEVVRKAYEAMPKISVDYAVAEREKNFAVIQADFYWTDIGDWKEVWENRKKTLSAMLLLMAMKKAEK